MAERINKVILVLDRDYDGELSSVASDSHVWLIESPANREAAASYWALHETPTAESGVTTFQAAEDASASEICLNILTTIDLHHAGYSSNPAYSVLEVVGARLNPVVKTALEELGFSTFESTVNGFRATR
jgi:hypothetical protein